MVLRQPAGSRVWCCGARVRQAQVSGGGRGGGHLALGPPLPSWAAQGRARAEAGLRASGPGCGLLAGPL